MGDRQWTGFEDLRYYKLNDHDLNGHDISHRPVKISTIPVQFQPIAIESATALILVGCDASFCAKSAVEARVGRNRFFYQNTWLQPVDSLKYEAGENKTAPRSPSASRADQATDNCGCSIT